jgi:GTP pyrophosphokinase
MNTLDDLINKIESYAPSADTGAVARAYDFAVKYHGTQKRASGEPFYMHPVNVAGILADMKMDVATIVTAILHDTIEDTGATKDQLIDQFGAEVADLVDGVTKISQIDLREEQHEQAENFRKLFLAMARDIRVLLVKLADRLHNMRTLHFLPSAKKRRRKASETIELYAPLAGRIGIQQFKEELQDLAFAELNPEARESIGARLSYLRKDGSNVVQRIIKELRELMADQEIEADITGREKTRYSIWRKMKRKNVAFEQLSDIMAFRIIVDNVEECYHALGVIHAEYSVVPGRFKDYISTPKRNGYRSLHTTIIGPEFQRIEVQIRTEEMHQVAEFGVAAHWAYKQSGEGAKNTNGEQYGWLQEILDIMDQAQQPEEFLEHTKLELFQDQVFCFTPEGDLIELPRGATPIDFAYAVHSEVGDTCVGAKVNGRITPLTSELDNGDQIEILTSKNSQPSPTWERHVVTGKARSRIRRHIRQQKRDEYIQLGRSMLQKVFREEGKEFDDAHVRDVLEFYDKTSVEGIFVDIGSGSLVARDVFHQIFPDHGRKSSDGGVTTDSLVEKARQRRRQKEKQSDKTALPITGLIPGMAIHYARCCHPLPGDPIVGIVVSGRGVTIHHRGCDVLDSFKDNPERWIDVAWNEEGDDAVQHSARLSVTLENKPGSLGNFSTIIGKNEANITNLKVLNRAPDFYDLIVDVDVDDRDHLQELIASLRAMTIVADIKRDQQG